MTTLEKLSSALYTVYRKNDIKIFIINVVVFCVFLVYNPVLKRILYLLSL